MALLIQTNSIVTTYPMYVIRYGDYSHTDIYSWLTQYTKHVGIGRTFDMDLTMAWRVYTKLEPKIEALFMLKYNARLAYDTRPQKQWLEYQ